MSVEALKNLCTCLSLSTEGNKADLIERLTLASGLAQPQQNGLSESMEGEAMSQSDDESRDKRSKRAKRVSKDAAGIKALLKEIKHLREDVNHITERVEVSNMRSEINKNWPVVKFERARDQFEYNALCAIGNDLDLALSASTGDEIIRHIESARTKTLDHTVVLNVAKEYGWEVAVELPQSKSEGLSAYGEIIEHARQAQA
ncbi:22658_t:CDS:2 [Gigaspora rosea]|nr:22658_t:CDS:2 [Gigaspora rosea]